MIFLAVGENVSGGILAVRKDRLTGNPICGEVAPKSMTDTLPADRVVAPGFKNAKHRIVSGCRLLPGKISPAGFFAQPATINNYDHDQKQ
jgi:hypothetical protein